MVVSPNLNVGNLLILLPEESILYTGTALTSQLYLCWTSSPKFHTEHAAELRG